MRMQISLCTKFQLKQTILIFEPSLHKKRYFQSETEKNGFSRAPMVFTYYIKLFRTWIDRPNGISISLLVLVAETVTI